MRLPRSVFAPLVPALLVALLGLTAEAQRPSPSPPPAASLSPAPRTKEVLVYGGSDASPPYQYLDEQGQPQGFNVDLIRALARVSGRKIEIRLGKWSAALDEVTSHELDLITVAYTEERGKRFAYLDEVWTIRQAVLFLPGRDSYPKSLMELANERVAVQDGSLTQEILLAVPEVVRPVIVPARDHTAAVELLRNGGATAVAGNSLVLQTALSHLGVRDIHEVIAKATSYRLATARGRESEMAWVSKALQALKDSGEFSLIVEKHLAERPPERTLREYGLIAAMIVGALALIAAFVLSWNQSLRAQVEIRTRQIAEAAAEKDRLARSLAEREQRMRVVAEQIPAVLWSTDRELVMTSASGLGLATLGLESSQLVGRPVGEALEALGVGQTAVLGHLRRGLLGRSSDLEVKIMGRDFEVHVEPLRDVRGETSGLVGLTLDVTERIHTARALRESEERYRAFVERSTEGIWRWELNEPWPKDKTVDEQLEHFLNHAYVAECNDAMARLYGLTKAHEAVGKTYAEVRRLRPTPAKIDHMRNFIASGCQSTEWESDWIDHEGTRRWSVTTVVGIVEEGALIRTWATQQDITLRKQAEEGLRNALSLLEVKNAELERFTYTVSHDLKSPLITIRGYLGHLEPSVAAGNLDQFREDAARINRAASKMEELLRDLLELSRIGRVLNPDEDVAMAAVAQDAVDLVQGPLQERGVQVAIEDGLPIVRGDRRRLVEVIQNLVENAVKFMGSQTRPLIRIGSRLEPLGAVFYVRDNGIGIDTRHRDKVFELFEKLTPGTEGTGVGLALVKRIIEAHGGRVWVESEGPGLGSTFCFTLRPAA